MYAMIESSGRQYKVSKGEIVFFEKLNLNEGDKVNFDKVILISDDNNIQIGDPYVKGAKVTGKVVSNGKHKKIIVYKMKPKKNYRRKQGHRQPYTKVEITDITLKDSKSEAKETAVEKTKVVKEAKIEPKVVKETKPKTTETKAVKEIKPKATETKTVKEIKPKMTEAKAVKETKPKATQTKTVKEAKPKTAEKKTEPKTAKPKTESKK